MLNVKYQSFHPNQGLNILKRLGIINTSVLKVLGQHAFNVIKYNIPMYTR
jgi:hypothetical protein